MIYMRPVQYINSLLSKYPYMNMGGDSRAILCCYKQLGEQITSRILISSSQSQLFLSSKTQLWMIPSNANLETTNETQIRTYPLITTWSCGAGLFSKDNIYTGDGSDWYTYDGTNSWVRQGGDFDSLKYYEITKSHFNIYEDYIIDITNIENEFGYLIKFKDQSINYGAIQFYSYLTDTHLFPKYVYYVDDYTYTTSSYQIVDPQDYVVRFLNLQQRYEKQQTIKLKIKFLPKQYSRDWTTSAWSSQRNSWCLPSNIFAYYQIYDITDIEIFKVYGYSQYTKMSCDGINNYFMLDIQSLPRNKFYTINIKIENKIYNNLGVFKVV